MDTRTRRILNEFKRFHGVTPGRRAVRLTTVQSCILVDWCMRRNKMDRVSRFTGN